MVCELPVLTADRFEPAQELSTPRKATINSSICPATTLGKVRALHLATFLLRFGKKRQEVTSPSPLPPRLSSNLQAFPPMEGCFKAQEVTSTGRSGVGVMSYESDGARFLAVVDANFGVREILPWGVWRCKTTVVVAAQVCTGSFERRHSPGISLAKLLPPSPRDSVYDYDLTPTEHQ